MRTPSTASATSSRRSVLLSGSTRQWATGPFAVPDQHLVDLPPTQTRHMLSRFTAGPTSERVAEVAAAGGTHGWFERQLDPGSIPDPAAAALWSWFPSLALTPLQKWERAQSGAEEGWETMRDLASWVMLRRLLTKRQLEEMMVDFWSNLLHVASPSPTAWVWRVEYEEMIRSHALGRFDDLLQDAIRHPAMGLYLNNVESTADAINENLGRELLECHTVGVDAGYTEAQVVASARILTGFHVDSGGTWAASYVPADHWVGRVRVLGFSSPNSAQDGRPILAQYLSYLSHHPMTAQRLCLRLANRFVSDAPSQKLVETLARVYLDSDTHIVPVLRALVASDEFQGSVMEKVATPVEDALATWTAVGADVARPRGDDDAAHHLIDVSNDIGQVVYDWPTPNGFPDVGTAWTGSGRLLGSMRAHWYAASGAFPSEGIAYRTPMSWMPTLPTTFDNVVDGVVRQALFLDCTTTMLKAACAATDIHPKEVITKSHPLVQYKFPRLLVSILDSAEHLKR